MARCLRPIVAGGRTSCPAKLGVRSRVLRHHRHFLVPPPGLSPVSLPPALLLCRFGTLKHCPLVFSPLTFPSKHAPSRVASLCFSCTPSPLSARVWLTPVLGYDLTSPLVFLFLSYLRPPLFECSACNQPVTFSPVSGERRGTATERLERG